MNDENMILQNWNFDETLHKLYDDLNFDFALVLMNFEMSDNTCHNWHIHGTSLHVVVHGTLTKILTKGTSHNER